MALQKLSQKKGSIALYIVLLVIALATMLMLRQCSTQRIGPRPDDIAGGDTINVAIEISPSGLDLTGDSLSGEYYNLLQRISKSSPDSSKLIFKFHPYTRLEDALEWLNEGRCRIVVGDIPVTAELKEKYIFVDPVALDKQVLVQLRDSLATDTLADGHNRFVENQFDLAKREVHVAKGSPYVQRLLNLSHEIGDTIYVIEDQDYSSEQLTILTATGQIPLAVVSESTAKALASRYPMLDHTVNISFNQFQSFILQPSDTLLRNRINSALK